MIHKLALYYNTLIRIPPRALLHRLAFQIKRRFAWGGARCRVPNGGCRIEVAVEQLDFDAAFLQRFDTAAIGYGKFRFLCREEQIDTVRLWDKAGLPALWLFNLHYFEYAYAFIAKIRAGGGGYDELKALISRWIDSNPYARGHGWHPYVISIRLPVFMACAKVFEGDCAFLERLVNSIYCQYIFLSKNLELHAKGSNHYLENLKALVAASAFFGQSESLERYFKAYVRELESQVNSDGMHCELSPMYHRIALEGAIKVYIWRKRAGGEGDHKLAGIINAMCTAMYSLERGTGRIPFFNDSAEGVAKSTESLLRAAAEHCGVKPAFKSALSQSGYYIMENGNLKLIADCGEPGWAHNPGHAHCDGLSYELYWNGRPVIVNSGTYTYQKDRWRQSFRSTAYHNTVVVDCKEQSEIWAAFRVARRASVVGARLENGVFAGEMISYNGVRHKREISLKNGDSYTICDKIEAKSKTNDIKSYIHIHPDFTLVDINGIIYIGVSDMLLFSLTLLNASVEKISRGGEENGWYSHELGKKLPAWYILIKPLDINEIFGYTVKYIQNTG